MPRKNKFKKGPKILTIARFCWVIQFGGWVYMYHKPLHPGFITSMPFRTVQQMIDRGALWEAVANEPD